MTYDTVSVLFVVVFVPGLTLTLDPVRRACLNLTIPGLTSCIEKHVEDYAWLGFRQAEDLNTYDTEQRGSNSMDRETYLRFLMGTEEVCDEKRVKSTFLQDFKSCVVNDVRKEAHCDIADDVLPVYDDASYDSLCSHPQTIVDFGACVYGSNQSARCTEDVAGGPCQKTLKLKCLKEVAERHCSDYIDLFESYRYTLMAENPLCEEYLQLAGHRLSPAVVRALFIVIFAVIFVI